MSNVNERAHAKAVETFQRREKELVRAFNAYLKARARVARYDRRADKALGGSYDWRELSALDGSGAAHKSPGGK